MGQVVTTPASHLRPLGRTLMDSDGQETQSDKERLLEEIRRRAEEAELKRLEEEEHAQGPAPQDKEPSPTGGQPDVPAFQHHGDASALPSKPVRDQKVLVLKERLTIALDRGKIDKAVDLLNELSALIPESPEVKEFRHRLDGVQKEKQQAAERKRTSTERRGST